MKIGNYELKSLMTSYFGLDGGAMFGIIPKPLWESKLAPDDKNRIPMCTRNLLLVSEDKKIIIDTGNGDKWNEKLKSIYNIRTDEVNLEQSLKENELIPDDITDVICTHLHFDHVGGNTMFDSNGKLIPTFPNATYWIPETNWNLANQPTVKDKASYFSHNWSVLAENDMVKFVKGNEQFLEGIEFIITNGHTTGQQHPLICDQSTKLLYGADLFPTSMHIDIPWVMAYDLYPLMTIKEKMDILPTMVDENWILFFEHDVTTECATLDYDGKRYAVKDSFKLNGS
tara:strand:+ start:19400 stop:20254 length:855 start_codon:yes stop_codon:yes gene_type:complete